MTFKQTEPMARYNSDIEPEVKGDKWFWIVGLVLTFLLCCVWYSMGCIDLFDEPIIQEISE